MTEQYAEDLYGPPMELDEDPNNTAAVTDPGNAGSYVYLGLQAGALDCTHLGRQVRITAYDPLRNERRELARGRLTAIQHRASWISERALCQTDEELVLGRRQVLVTLDHKYSHLVSDTAQVEFYRG